jgi:predicted permease
MLRNYLKIALRTLYKHKTHSAINVLGLAVAFGASTLLFLSAYFEWSFDRFHADHDRIFRTYFVIHRPDRTDQSATMPYPMTPALNQEFPEVQGVTRLLWTSGVVQRGEKQFRKNIRCADADLLTMFSFPLKQGDARSALNSLSGIVISENMARDVFGTENPMGKTLRVGGFGNWKDFAVTGVLADAPDNSSIEYDAFVRVENRPDYAANKDRWDNTNHEVFLKLAPGVTQDQFEKRLQAFTKKYFAGNIRDLQQLGAKPDERGEVYSTRLQPLTDVHFDTGLVRGLGVSRMYVYTTLTIALFILLIAGINFVNLTLARSLTRAREVGVRKSIGATQGQLFGQLWGETLLLCAAGLGVGLGAAVLLRPKFNQLFGAKLTLDLLLQPGTWVAILGGFLVVTLLAGGYPAWVMARYRTVEVLKGKLKTGRPGLLRNALIVSQFAIACALIASTFVILSQIRFLREKPLGFNEEQVISLPVGSSVDGRAALNRLRNHLAGNPHVVSVTGTMVNLGAGLDGSSSRSMMGFLHQGKEVTTDWLRVDYDYLKTLGIKLLDGRDFSRAYPTDSLTSVIVSESMARKLGEKNPVGVFFQPDSAGPKFQVIGVIPDFHLYALRNKVEPITLHMNQAVPIQYVFVRVTPQGMVPVMDALKREWKQVAPKAEFEASFLNENTDRWYRREEKLSTIFSIAAAIAVTLSCLGLFAVALLRIEQRTKEIGVRKVLGASVASLVALLSGDFLKLVLVGILIASPLAWWAMSQWLSDFAYRIDMPWWVFVAAGVLAVLIALLAVSYQSVKAALTNPVKSLRTE